MVDMQSTEDLNAALRTVEVWDEAATRCLRLHCQAQRLRHRRWADVLRDRFEEARRAVVDSAFTRFRSLSPQLGPEVRVTLLNLVSAVQQHWLWEIEGLREKHRSELAERDEDIQRLRKKLENKQASASRRGVTTLEVYRAYSAERPVHDSEKAALQALRQKRGWNPKTVSRRALEFYDQLARIEHCRVAQIREHLAGRPARRSAAPNGRPSATEVLEDAETPAALAEAKLARPRVRAHCKHGPRPCPWVRCRMNLSLDVTSAGDVLEREVPEGVSNCALDHAARGQMSLEEIARTMGISREEVRNVDAGARRKLESSTLAAALRRAS